MAGMQAIASTSTFVPGSQEATNAGAANTSKAPREYFQFPATNQAISDNTIAQYSSYANKDIQGHITQKKRSVDLW